ncbi:MAG TPA: CapA family protein [Kofleriaceae bacterium]|nr:CapA family protein [Kofleriaceae bacterium]
MLRWVVVALVACRGATSERAAPPIRQPPAIEPAPIARPARRPPACEAAVPGAACALRGGLTTCPADAAARVGEWRYAVIASLYAPVEDIRSAQLTRAWQRGELAATAETAAAIATLLGPGAPAVLAPGEHPVPGAGQLAIVPADQLVPAWKVVTVDGHHPLDAAPGPLAVPLCATDGDRSAARNIDPARLTTVAITGVTAMTRLTAELMDRKGVTYPIKDVEPWLAAVDLVHISNEVSFVGKECKPYRSLQTEFCAREGYIQLLEAAHARIIELTGSHLPDYGRSWIDHTLELYRERGWVWFGGGHDQRDATAPRIVEHHGNQLAFIGCNMPWTTSRVITEGPGVGACDLERIRWQIGDLVRRHIVPIVSIQHEEVYHHEPPDVIVRDFRLLAEAGAAVVNGSQAHCAHPWEVHHGAYLHYGGGNFVFDQQAANTQDAAADKLYVHAGRLLTVGHLYTRLEEHGRPRPMTAHERTGFLAVMAGALAHVPPADPWAPPRLAPDTRRHPDSFLVGRDLERVYVTPPATLVAGKRYPLVIEVRPGRKGEVSAADAADAAAFVVAPRAPGGAGPRLAAAIARFMVARYAVDADRITVRGGGLGLAHDKARPRRVSVTR